MPVVGLWSDYQDVFARGNGECMMKKLRSQRVLIRDETLIEQFALLLFTCAALALYSDCNARGAVEMSSQPVFTKSPVRLIVYPPRCTGCSALRLEVVYRS